MTAGEKKGAMLFFGKAGCVSCHAVSGASNEMFSDFTPHVIGVPQIVPAVTNSVFDGPGANEDFGLEQVTQDPADRYKFRTAPLRNLAVMPALPSRSKASERSANSTRSTWVKLSVPSLPLFAWTLITP